MVTVQQYNPDLFSSLPDMETGVVASKITSEFKSKIEQCGTVIEEYGHADNGGACLVHKHSDLAPGHLLVMTFEHDKSFTRPTPVLAAEVVPHTVCFTTSDGGKTFDLVPLEFFDPRAKGTEIMKQRISALLEDQDFLFSYARKLHELDLLDSVGLSIYNSDPIPHNIMEDMLIETTALDGTLVVEAASRAAISEGTMEKIIPTFFAAKGPFQRGCFYVRGCIPAGRGGHVSSGFHNSF